jgi:hypothetical protein
MLASEMRWALFIARNDQEASTLRQLLNEFNDCACRFLDCGDYSGKHFTPLDNRI